MRALHIAELDNRHRGLRWALRGAVHSFFQLGAGVVKWLCTEGQDVTCNCMLAVRGNQQPIRGRALRVGDNHQDLRQSRHLGGMNLVHLPRDGGIVAKHLEEERVDSLFSGENRRACTGRRSGHWFGRRSSLESGRGLSDADAGQQKSSKECAMDAYHILIFEWNSIVTKTGAVVISGAFASGEPGVLARPPLCWTGETPVAPPNFSSSRGRGARTRPWLR